MLYAKNVLGRFWAEAMNTAAFMINRLPQQRLCYLSPFEKLWDMKPIVGYFRVFDCVCYVFIPDQLHSKMDKKAVRCIFVGLTVKENGGAAEIQQLKSATHPGMWCLMKPPYGGPLTRKYYQNPLSKIRCNLPKCSYKLMNLEVQMMILTKVYHRIHGK